MGNNENIKNELKERVEDFRYFELKGKPGETGDRFLMPWIYSHMFGTGKQTKSVIKRAT